MKRKILAALVMLTVLAVLATGCGVSEVADPSASPTASSDATAAPSPSPEDSSYSVTDSQGTVMLFDETPGTVISLAPNITEIIFALGQGDKLVARTDWCNYPFDEVNDIVSVGNMDQPDVEKILELQPDLVLLSEITMKDIAMQIKDAGIPFFVIDNEESFEGAYTSIEMVGAVLKAEEKAAEITSGMKTIINDIIARVSGADKPTVYYVMGYGEYGDFTAGRGTFISGMISAAGGINVADDTDGWSYSVEKIVEHNPDLLLLSVWAPAEGLREANGYKDLDAVKQNRMYTIDDDTLQRLGPRLAEAFVEMAKAIHPELFE
ncbi:MAG: ABC transporter substrate-binding protein [Clostridia bacterium]|nr:ABC transporter substrate-binding protein [Clostridia bacterium]